MRFAGGDAVYSPLDNLGNVVHAADLEVSVEQLGEPMLVEMCTRNHEVLAMATIGLGEMWQVRAPFDSDIPSNCALQFETLHELRLLQIVLTIARGYTRPLHGMQVAGNHCFSTHVCVHDRTVRAPQGRLCGMCLSAPAVYSRGPFSARLTQ